MTLVPDWDISDTGLKLDRPNQSRTGPDRLPFGTDRGGNQGIDRILQNSDRPDRGIDKCRSVSFDPAGTHYCTSGKFFGKRTNIPLRFYEIPNMPLSKLK